MIITPFKIIMLGFIFFAWTRVLLRYKEKVFGGPGLMAWTAIWAVSAYFVLTPGKSDVVARYLGVSRGTDAVFSLAIILMAYLVYRLYASASYQQKIITKLVRELALSTHRKESQSKIKSLRRR